MHEPQPSSPSRKKAIIAASEDFLLGYAALVPPIFVAGLLYNVALEKFQPHEKTALYSFLLLIAIVNTGIERYKREHPSEAQTYDYPQIVKFADVFFATTQGFGSVAIIFLALAIYEGLTPIVQAFHLPILIAALTYATTMFVKTIIEKNAISQSNDPERQAILRRNREEDDGCIADTNRLIDYMNNALFAAAFQVAPVEFVLDGLKTLTLPAFISLFAIVIAVTLVRGVVFNYKRHHPDITAKDYPSLIKAIELAFKANDSFGLFVIPILVLNSFFPLNEGIQLAGVAMAIIYSIISTINKADDLGLVRNRTASESEDNVSCWQSVKNAATNCCGFFSSSREYRRNARKYLESFDESNLDAAYEQNRQSDQSNNEEQNTGCWNTFKKSAASCLNFFSSSTSTRKDSDSSLLLRRHYTPLNS